MMQMRPFVTEDRRDAYNGADQASSLREEQGIVNYYVKEKLQEKTRGKEELSGGLFKHGPRAAIYRPPGSAVTSD